MEKKVKKVFKKQGKYKF